MILKSKRPVCACVPDEHGLAHHAGEPDGGAEQQSVLFAGDERGIKRFEHRLEPWPRVPGFDEIVKGSPMADFIKRQLRARNIRFEGLEVEQGRPWGYRHQFNVADSGFGLRAPRLWNDRAGEVGRTLSIEDFDVERIFGQEGVGILHLSGLSRP